MDGKIIDDPNEIANGFNNYFARIGAKLASKKFAINGDYLKYMPTVNSRFKFRLISSSEMKSIINKLRNASPGHDFLPMSLFKDNIDHLIDVISYTCNLSLSKGIFPDDLMLAVVTCIYKAVDPQLFGNYSPITVLPAFSKILEKIVINQFTERVWSLSLR